MNCILRVASFVFSFCLSSSSNRISVNGKNSCWRQVRDVMDERREKSLKTLTFNPHSQNGSRYIFSAYYSIDIRYQKINKFIE